MEMECNQAFLVYHELSEYGPDVTITIEWYEAGQMKHRMRMSSVYADLLGAQLMEAVRLGTRASLERYEQHTGH